MDQTMLFAFGLLPLCAHFAIPYLFIKQMFINLSENVIYIIAICRTLFNTTMNDWYSTTCNYLRTESCLKLSYDHTPLLVTISIQIINRTKPPALTNKQTYWHIFHEVIRDKLSLHLFLKCGNDDEAVKHLTTTGAYSC